LLPLSVAALADGSSELPHAVSASAAATPSAASRMSFTVFLL
jgi:hypothetical protein